MDSTSGGQPSSDPEQWWQPDYQDDPEYKQSEDLYHPDLWEIDHESEAIGDLFDYLKWRKPITTRAHGGGYHNPRQGGKSSYSVTDEAGEPPRHIWHTHLEAVRDAFKVTQDTVDVIAGIMNPTIQALRPLVEVTQGHHAVCKHKPRCKKPGPGAAFNTPVTSKRRPRKSNR